MLESAYEGIDKKIDAAVSKLVDMQAQDVPDKKPYAELVSKLADLDLSSPPKDILEHSKMARLQRCCVAVSNLKKHGAATYFSANPVGMSQVLALWLGNTTEDTYKSLNSTENHLLNLFRERWEQQVAPLVAERIKAYGQEKLAAQGLEKCVRDWVETHHTTLKKISEEAPPENYDLQAFCRAMDKLHEMDKDPQKADWRTTEGRLRMAEHFSVSENTNKDIMSDLKQMLRSASTKLAVNISTRTKEIESLQELRDIFWELVEMPSFHVSSLLSPEK